MKERADPVSTTIVIQPKRGLGRLGLRELWEYRGLIKYLVLRNIHGRYRPTSLGLFWIVITPLCYMLIYTIVFGGLFGIRSGDVPYPIYVYSGFAAWMFFSNGVTKASTSLVGNKHLMNKVYFPRMVSPLVSIIDDMVDFGISFIPLFLICIYYRFTPGWTVLLAPFFMLMFVAATTALGLWLSALSVNLRDVGVALPIVFRAWLYLSPVVYPVALIPESWRSVYYLNPMAVLMQGYRWALLGAEPPPGQMLLITVALITIGLLAAIYYFRCTERDVVDSL